LQEPPTGPVVTSLSVSQNQIKSIRAPTVDREKHQRYEKSGLGIICGDRTETINIAVADVGQGRLGMAAGP
jgi:hypothetical protein